MSNSRMYQFSYTYETRTAKIYMHVEIGASGAPTLTSNMNKGIVSMSRTAAGKYTINLKDQFNRLLNVTMCSLNSAASAAPDINVIADNSNSSTSPNIQIETSSGGVSTDPGNGEILLLEITMKDSSV